GPAGDAPAGLRRTVSVAGRRVPQRPPLLGRQEGSRRRVVHAGVAEFVRVQPAREILDESEDVGQRPAGLGQEADLARELPKLHVLEGELALRIAIGKTRPTERREERPLLTGGPEAEAFVKFGDRQAVGGLVAPVEGLPK